MWNVFSDVRYVNCITKTKVLLKNAIIGVLLTAVVI